MYEIELGNDFTDILCEIKIPPKTKRSLCPTFCYGLILNRLSFLQFLQLSLSVMHVTAFLRDRENVTEICN